MSGQDSIDAMNVEMDAANLYKDEVVTDRKVGTIRILKPVLPTGERDEARPLIFMGEAQIMTQMGPLRRVCVTPSKRFRQCVVKLLARS